MRIAIIGSGYVGLVAAACFAEIGHHVVCVDSDAQKVAALKSGRPPIHEEFLPELLKEYTGRELVFSGDVTTAVRNCEAVFIAVGTPTGCDGRADLSCVEQVAREVGRAGGGFKLVIEKSTVPVHTAEQIRHVLAMEGARDFAVASNPEFLREGTAVTDFLYPDRIVVGSDEERASELLRQIYAPLTSGDYYRRGDAIPRPDGAPIPPPLIETSTKSAEMIKQSANAYLAMRISFINAVANLCEAVGASVEEVCHGMGSDRRIGSAFLKPGIGFGGGCFPKDLEAFRAVAQSCGDDFRLLDEVRAINEQQRERFLQKARRALWTLKGKRLAVLGLSFKGGTDDIRESPAIDIVRRLVGEGASVTAYDPAAMPRAREIFGTLISFADDAYAAADDADALLILSDWEEFAALDLARLQGLLRYPVVIDGRNLYSCERMAAEGFYYHSVGRAQLQPRAAKVLKMRKAS